MSSGVPWRGTPRCRRVAAGGGGPPGGPPPRPPAPPPPPGPRRRPPPAATRGRPPASGAGSGGGGGCPRCKARSRAREAPAGHRRDDRQQLRVLRVAVRLRLLEGGHALGRHGLLVLEAVEQGARLGGGAGVD